ncbi:MAG: hypothetical protein LAQ30_29880 [Acidobacteriia bacterium]|nr:hypothetical protein [Terriglobia bacterium]
MTKTKTIEETLQTLQAAVGGDLAEMRQAYYAEHAEVTQPNARPAKCLLVELAERAAAVHARVLPEAQG